MIKTLFAILKSGKDKKRTLDAIHKYALLLEAEHKAMLDKLKKINHYIEEEPDMDALSVLGISRLIKEIEK